MVAARRICPHDAGDQYLSERLERVVAMVAETTRPDGIILGGSAGRGEAVVVRRGSGPDALSDFEISVVRRAPIPRSLLERLEREATAATGIETHFWWNHPRKFRSALMKRRTINNYEFIAASRTLMGREFLRGLPAPLPVSLPAQEGVMLILNRLFELAAADPKTAAYKVTKVATALRDASVLRAGEYHWSYLERQRRWESRFAGRWPDLDEMLAHAHAARFQGEPLPWFDPQKVLGSFEHASLTMLGDLLGLPLRKWEHFPRALGPFMRRADRAGRWLERARLGLKAAVQGRWSWLLASRWSMLSRAVMMFPGAKRGPDWRGELDAAVEYWKVMQ